MSASDRYIPLSRDEAARLAARQLPAAQQAPFLKLSRLVSAWYHHQMLDHLSQQKADLTMLQSAEADAETADRFAASLERAAHAANFRSIPEHELTEALAEESTFRIRLAVDFSHFEQVVFYGRGRSTREAEITQWFGLKRETVRFRSYESVLVFIRFKTDERVDEALRGRLVLKLFGDIPQADLEMLFPNSEVRMRLTDKLFIGVPAFVSGLIVLFTKLGSSLLLAGALLAFWLGLSSEQVSLDQAALVGLMTGAGALGGYLWKQFSNFKNRKIRFMKALTERLYFKNLDNYGGVLTALADYAEESESKEVLLAYAALLGGEATTPEQIQAKVEAWLAPHEVNFDVSDAIGKLLAIGFAHRSEDRLQAVPIEDAYAALDLRWDDLFSV